MEDYGVRRGGVVNRIRNRTWKCSAWLEALQYLLITEQELVV